MRVRGVLFTTGVVLAALGWLAAPAGAVNTYKLEGSFGPFNYPAGVTVDGSAGSEGDVWVAEYYGGVVKYNAAGTEQLLAIGSSNIPGSAVAFVNPSWVAVDPSNGDIYVSDLAAKTVTKFDKEGKFIYQISAGGSPSAPNASWSPAGVAVDPATGDLIVGDRENKLIDRFTPAGAFVSPQLAVGEVGEVDGLALDAAGDIFVVSQSESVREFKPSGEPANCSVSGTNLLTTSAPSAVAVDTSNGTILAGEYDESSSFQIGDYNATCAPATVTFGQGDFAGYASYGMAVNAVGTTPTHTLYADDFYGGKVDIFKPVVLPSGVTGIAKKIKHTSAELCGTVNPESATLPTNYQFEYGTSTSYGQVAPAAPVSVGTGSEANEVCTKIEGLTPGTVYHFRLRVENENGPVYGNDASFEAPTAVEGVTTGNPTNVKATTVTLNGSLEPNETEAHYYFQYGETESYGSVSPELPGTPVNGGAGVLVPVTANVSGLKPETEYHYRLVATNALGTSYGKDVAFKTHPAVEGLATGVATNIAARSATLNGSLEPNETEAHYYFQYGEAESGEYSAVSPALPGTPVNGASGVVVPSTTGISGLTPGVEYRFRLVATDRFGTTYGGEARLKTLAAEPVVDGQFVSAVTLSSALLIAQVNPDGEQSTYHFEYGTSSAYGTSAPVPDGLLGTGTSDIKLTQQLTGLQPGVTYHFRVVASNAHGSADGPDQTFTTVGEVLPSIGAASTSEVSQNGVVLSGSVNPQGAQTYYEFDLGVDTSYGTRVFGDAGIGAGPVAVSAPFVGLAAGTTYHYRLAATNTYGTTYGPDQTFTTPGYPTATLSAPLTPALIAIPPAVFPAGEPVVSSTKKKQSASGRRRKKTSKKKKARKTSRKARGRGAGNGRSA
jgi:hypothetical protein